MKNRTLSILKPLVRWGIAIGAIAWVVSQLTIRDRVNVVMPDLSVVSAALMETPTPEGDSFVIKDPATLEVRTISRDDVISRPDRPDVEVNLNGQPQTRALLGVHLEGDINRNPSVDKLLVAQADGSGGEWITPDQVVGGYQLRAPRPLIETGLASMTRDANLYLLLASIAVFPVTFIVTSVRWWWLLKALDIHLRLSRAFVLNMVGSFYNTFLPGSSGGDVLKAYYVSKQTTHKIRGVLSVFIDRAIGLLTLVIMGGSLAAYQYFTADDPDSPTAQACKHVAIACSGIVFACLLGLAALGSETVRHLTGLSFIVRRMPEPVQRMADKAHEVGSIYKRRPVLIVSTLIMTIPVHLTVIVSALLAGQAFDLPISLSFYFIAVPVIVLVTAIPISPQGAGVAELFAISLTARQGATVSEALALSMSIRIVQILWNLTGGLFVMRGGFSAPPADAQEQIVEQDEKPDASVPQSQM